MSVIDLLTRKPLTVSFDGIICRDSIIKSITYNSMAMYIQVEIGQLL